MYNKKIIFIVFILFFFGSIFASEKKSNSLLDFFISTEFSFQNIDKTEIFTRDGLNKIKKEDFDLVYLDNTDYFGFGGTCSLSYTYVLFDENARNKLIKAEKQYLSDFENKRLDRKGSKTDRIYGHNPTKFLWGAIKMQAKNVGTTESYFGYKFKDGSPYFTITCPETYNEKYDPNYNKTYPKTSFTATYFFTKSQLHALTEFLKEDNISQILLEVNHKNFTEFENDSY